MVQFGVFRVGEVFHAKMGFGFSHALFREGDVFFFFVLFKIALTVLADFFRQTLDKAIRLVVQIRGLFAPAGNDERRARFVDENGVHFIHNGEVQRPLHHVFLVSYHVVSQVIKAELVVGAVGNIRRIGGLARLGVQVVDNQPHGHSQKAVNFAHPLAVVSGQIVVYGNNMHALAGKRVQKGGQRGGQGFALAGAHFRDAALMQHDGAQQLHVEGALTQHAHGGFPHKRVGFRQNCVQILPVPGAFLQLRGVIPHGAVGKRLHFWFQRADGLHGFRQFLDFRLVGAG